MSNIVLSVLLCGIQFISRDIFYKCIVLPHLVTGCIKCVKLKLSFVTSSETDFSPLNDLFRAFIMIAARSRRDGELIRFHELLSSFIICFLFKFIDV